jgi:hypothetical protein
VANGKVGSVKGSVNAIAKGFLEQAVVHVIDKVSGAWAKLGRGFIPTFFPLFCKRRSVCTQ